MQFKLTKKAILGLASCVLLILQAVGLKFDFPVINEAIAGIASVLVMLGIISDGTSTGDSTASSSEDNTSEDNTSNENASTAVECTDTEEVADSAEEKTEKENELDENV